MKGRGEKNKIETISFCAPVRVRSELITFSGPVQVREIRTGHERATFRLWFVKLWEKIAGSSP